MTAGAGPGRRRGQRRAPGDAGFTLVEVVLALVLVVVVGAASLPIASRLEGTVSLARQRQWAVGAATQAVERLRALPYATVVAGLRADDLAGDPYAVQVGGVWRLVVPAAVAGTPTGISEALRVNGSGAVPAPLYPHVRTPAGPYPTTFASPPVLGVYVTQDPAVAGVFVLTALVRWPAAGGQQQAVVLRTRLYSPPGSGGA